MSLVLCRCLTQFSHSFPEPRTQLRQTEPIKSLKTPFTGHRISHAETGCSQAVYQKVKVTISRQNIHVKLTSIDLLFCTI